MGECSTCTGRKAVSPRPKLSTVSEISCSPSPGPQCSALILSLGLSVRALSLLAPRDDSRIIGHARDQESVSGVESLFRPEKQAVFSYHLFPPPLLVIADSQPPSLASRARSQHLPHTRFYSLVQFSSRTGSRSLRLHPGLFHLRRQSYTPPVPINPRFPNLQLIAAELTAG